MVYPYFHNLPFVHDKADGNIKAIQGHRQSTKAVSRPSRSVSPSWPDLRSFLDRRVRRAINPAMPFAQTFTMKPEHPQPLQRNPFGQNVHV